MIVNKFGQYLGTEKFNFVVKIKDDKIKSKPFYSVKEITLPSGNYVSTKALAWASIYGIKCARWLVPKFVSSSGLRLY